MNNFAFMLVLNSFRWPTKKYDSIELKDTRIRLEKQWHSMDGTTHSQQDIKPKISAVPCNSQYRNQKVCHSLTNPKDFVLCSCFFSCYITAASDLHTHNYNPYSCTRKNDRFFPPGVIISEYYRGTGPNKICLASKKPPAHPDPRGVVSLHSLAEGARLVVHLLHFNTSTI